MNNENKNYIEETIKKLSTDRKNLFVFIMGIIATIFSVIYISLARLNTVMLVYMLCTIVISASMILYAFDVDKSRKYTGDILICGTLLNLIGVILRIIQLGLMFSWKYYLLYLAFSIGLVLFITKHTKNEGKGNCIKIIFSLIIAYIIFEIVRISTMTTYIGLTWSFFRIAEICLALCYIIILIMNNNTYESFSEKLGKYKVQIPSLKICIIIILFISLVFGGIGAILKLNTKSKNTVTTPTTVTQNATKEVDPTNTPQKNKAANTVSGGNTNTDENSAINQNAETSQSNSNDIADITIGQTVSSDKLDFTLNKVNFSYKVEPDNPPSWYTYYDAPENQVYIYINAKVKNKQKQAIEADEVYSVTVDYDGGYTYRGFNIADDTDGDFTYANITSVEPLQTLGVHCLVACPEEIETSDKPIILTITLKDGSKYKYQMR